jgi:hypothetical protein
LLFHGEIILTAACRRLAAQASNHFATVANANIPYSPVAYRSTQPRRSGKRRVRSDPSVTSSDRAFKGGSVMNTLICIEAVLTFGLAICLMLRAMGVGI